MIVLVTALSLIASANILPAKQSLPELPQLVEADDEAALLTEETDALDLEEIALEEGLSDQSDDFEEEE